MTPAVSLHQVHNGTVNQHLIHLPEPFLAMSPKGIHPSNPDNAASAEEGFRTITPKEERRGSRRNRGVCHQSAIMTIPRYLQFQPGPAIVVYMYSAIQCRAYQRKPLPACRPDGGAKELATCTPAFFSAIRTLDSLTTGYSS
jgi:hypothetical protein